MPVEIQAQPLPKKTKIFYGIGDIGNALINSAIQFYLMKFYTDGALVSPALAGNALLRNIVGRGERSLIQLGHRP